MGAFESESGGSANVEHEELLKGMQELQNVEWLEVEKQDLPADLKSAIQRVVQFLGKVVGGGYPSPKSSEKKDVKKELPTDLKTAIQRVVQFLDKVAGGKYPFPVSTKKQDEEDEEEKRKAKVKEEEEKAKKAKEPEDEEKNKSVSAPTITVHPDGRVEVSGQDVTKGKSQFTAERTDDLKSSVHKLLSMLANVDKEAAKGVIDELTKTLLPADVKWTSGTVATPASVKKAVEDGIASVVQPLTKRLDEIGGKVEEIAKARPAPQSSGGDGDPGTPVKKNFWGGLPLV